MFWLGISGGASPLVIGNQQARPEIELAREWEIVSSQIEDACTDREIAGWQAEKARAFTSLLATHQCAADRIRKYSPSPVPRGGANSLITLISGLAPRRGSRKGRVWNS